jgi:hypothetical protein
LFSGLTEESIPAISAGATVAGLLWHPANRSNIAKRKGNFFINNVEGSSSCDS